MNEDVAIICCFCGEQIWITVDPLAGRRQEYIEDCSVCCNPNLIQLHVDTDLTVTAQASRGND